MGNYTQFAELGAAAFQKRRRNAKRGGGDDGERPPLQETRFLCARCDEGYPFDASCPRCGHPVVDLLEVVPLPKHSDGVERTRVGSPLFVGLMAAVTLCCLALVLGGTTSIWVGSNSGSTSTTIGLLLLAALAVVAPIVSSRVSRRMAKSRRRRHRQQRRRAAQETQPVTTAHLPESTSEPVRVRGRIRLEPGPHEVRVRVTDEEGCADLRIAGEARAYAEGGDLRELEFLTDGDEVEVVGMGRRRTAAGDGFRAVDKTFEFDPAHPLDVWVRRK